MSLKDLKGSTTRGGKGKTKGGAPLGSIVGALFPALFLFAIFAAVGIVHVASRVLVMDAGYRLHKLESDNRRLTRDNDKLKLELATLRSPSKLEKIAREKLQMSAPGAGEVITVESVPTRLARASSRTKTARGSGSTLAQAANAAGAGNL